MKKLLSAVISVVLTTVTTLSAQALRTQRIPDTNIKPFFGYIENSVDDYHHYEIDYSKGDIFHHNFPGNRDIVTGTVINGISLTRNFIFKGYSNVLTGWFEDSYNTHIDNEFCPLTPVDESNPRKMICKTKDKNTGEDIDVHVLLDFDKLKRMTHVKTDDGVQIWITYRKNGKVSSYKDTYGNKFIFSAEGKLTSATYADGHTETITYDNRGFEISRKYSNGRFYTNTYNDHNRILTRTWNDGVVIHYEYDSRNLLCRQYTEYAGCNAALDEITYEWDKVFTETHADGSKYIIDTEDPWNPKYYTRYRVAEAEPLKQEMITPIPDDLYMFKNAGQINKYTIFADGDNIYLSGNSKEMQDYIWSDSTLETADLPIFSTLSSIERTGDYIMGLHDVYWQNFETPVQFYYNLPDDISHEMYTRGIYGKVMHGGRYVVPKGIVLHDNYQQDDSWCAIEYNGTQAVKFIPREEIDAWLAGQEGNFTLEAYSQYGKVVHRLFKNGKLYQRIMTVSYGDYYGRYVGSINGQFSIYAVLANTYGIFDANGKLVKYFSLPLDSNVLYSLDFNERGQLYAALTPEFRTQTIHYEDDFAYEYYPIEGKEGKLVELTGHLKDFGYLNSDAVKITRTPQKTGNEIGTFNRDTTFIILSAQTITSNGDSEYWYEIRLSDGTIGWVQAKYIDTFFRDI